MSSDENLSYSSSPILFHLFLQFCSSEILYIIYWSKKVVTFIIFQSPNKINSFVSLPVSMLSKSFLNPTLHPLLSQHPLSPSYLLCLLSLPPFVSHSFLSSRFSLTTHYKDDIKREQETMFPAL
jgi:hypothetical protein